MRNRFLTKKPLFLLFASLAFAGATEAQAPAKPSILRALAFEARPTKRLFTQGEAVVFVLSIRNQSPEPIFVSRLTEDEFVDFRISGPDGKAVPWRGKGRIDSKEYSPSDFAVLKCRERISAKRIISFKDGQGFVFNKPGQYSVTAEYSLGPPEYFAPLAGATKIPTGSFRSVNATFCVEVCGLASLK
jgi:hypothetical protein